MNHNVGSLNISCLIIFISYFVVAKISSEGMRQPTMHQNEGGKFHRGEVKEVKFPVPPQ
jgi:hypothetical protein